MYRRVIKGILTATALVLAQTGAQADPIPPGWSCTGNCGTLGPDGVVTAPPFGPTYQYISTASGSAGAGQIPGIGGTRGSELVTFPFSANAGDLLSFFFNYVTSDSVGFADYAWAELRGTAHNHIAWLFTARTAPPPDNTSPGFGLPPNDSTLTPPSLPIISVPPVWSPLGSSSGSCFAPGCGYTGWIESNYTIAAAGDFVLAFGTSNFIDTANDSGLAINGIRVASEPITSVPEPRSLILLGSALLGFGFLRHRRASGGVVSTSIPITPAPAS